MTVHLFFPSDTDQFTVTGPDNATYWLMLLVRSELIVSFKFVYYMAVTIEIVALVIGYTLHLRGFILFWKIRAIHINFLLTAVGMYAVMIIGAIARLLTIPYETRIVQFSGLYEAPIPLLAILRQASYAHSFYIIWMWTIERFCATIFVADYEKRTRIHISILLNVVFIPCSYATGYVIVTRIVNGFIVSLVAFAPNFICACLFRWLSCYNERRLALLTHRVKRHADGYNLSLRVQLKENVQSMKKIEVGVYLLTFGSAVNLILVFLPLILLTQKSQFEPLQWITCVGNLTFAFSILLTSPWLELANSMNAGRTTTTIQKILGTKRKMSMSISAIDGYFNQLNNQWNKLPPSKLANSLAYMTFRFFFPEPDPLTLIGPNNETYWLMLFVRSEYIHENKIVYYIAVIIEIFASTIGFGLHVYIFVKFWKLKVVHINLLITTAGMYVTLIVGAISRLLIIIYESRIVQFAGLYETPVPILAIIRQASFIHCFYVLWMWTIESYATGYAYVTRIVDGVMVTAIIFVPNIICAGIFRWLISNNEKRLARLTHHIKRLSDEYSLSLRLQLKENIWSMKKIEFGVYLLTAGLAANMVFIACPIIFLESPNEFETLQWLTCTGNVLFSLSVFCCSPWLMVAIWIHTENVPIFLIRILGKEYFTKKTPEPMSETEKYFNQLESQWNEGLNMNIHNNRSKYV